MEVCERTDRELGTRERIAFLPRRGDVRLFTCLCEPSDAPIGGVVLCPSVLADFTSNYQREVHLARRLAAEGLTTLRYHASGMGDSDGDPAEVTLQTLLDDALWATEALAAVIPGAPIAPLGTRWGAFAAAAVARSLSDHHAITAFIEPVTDFRRFFREAWRSRAMSHLANDEQFQKRQKLADVLSSQGWADVVGNVIYSPLYEDAYERDAISEFAGVAGSSLLVQFQGRGLRPEHQVLSERLTSQGAQVDATIVDVEESWWFRSGPKVTLNPELNDAVATWLVDQFNAHGG